MKKSTENNGTGRGSGGITGKGFMPGQSGNPKGRPKGPSLTRLMREQLQDTPDDGDPRALAERVVATAIEKAMSGNFSFFREILRRVDGPANTVTQRDHESDVVVIRMPAAGTFAADGPRSNPQL